MIPIILCTNNAHKVKEIQAIWDYPEIQTYQEAFQQPFSAVEDGHSFEENAIKKVRTPPHQDGVIYIAEDSGIEVAHLNGAPGIYSARYAGEHATKKDMCTKLLNACKDATHRDAQYQAAIAIRFPDESIQTVSGIVTGTLSHTMKGDGGFGYDPIFIPKGFSQTFAELPAEEKHRLSHRYHAIQQLIPIISKSKILSQ